MSHRARTTYPVPSLGIPPLWDAEAAGCGQEGLVSEEDGEER